MSGAYLSSPAARGAGERRFYTQLLDADVVIRGAPVAAVHFETGLNAEQVGSGLQSGVSMAGCVLEVGQQVEIGYAGRPGRRHPIADDGFPGSIGADVWRPPRDSGAGAGHAAERVLARIADPHHQLDPRDRRRCGRVAEPDVIDRVSGRAHRERPGALHRRELTNLLGRLVGSVELDTVVTRPPAADDGGEGSGAIVRRLVTRARVVREPNAPGGGAYLHRHRIPIRGEWGALHGIAVDAVHGLGHLVVPGRPVCARGYDGTRSGRQRHDALDAEVVGVRDAVREEGDLHIGEVGRIHGVFLELVIGEHGIGEERVIGYRGARHAGDRDARRILGLRIQVRRRRIFDVENHATGSFAAGSGRQGNREAD